MFDPSSLCFHQKWLPHEYLIVLKSQKNYVNKNTKIKLETIFFLFDMHAQKAHSSSHFSIFNIQPPSTTDRQNHIIIQESLQAFALPSTSHSHQLKGCG